MNKKRKGFTLVELIVVMAVLLVLSVLAVLAYSNIQENFRDAARSSDAMAVARSLNTYNSACGAGFKIGINTTDDGFLTTSTATNFSNTIKTDGIVFIYLDDAVGALIEMDLSVYTEPKRWLAAATPNTLFDYITYNDAEVWVAK